MDGSDILQWVNLLSSYLVYDRFCLLHSGLRDKGQIAYFIFFSCSAFQWLGYPMESMDWYDALSLSLASPFSQFPTPAVSSAHTRTRHSKTPHSLRTSSLISIPAVSGRSMRPEIPCSPFRATKVMSGPAVKNKLTLPRSGNSLQSSRSPRGRNCLRGAGRDRCTSFTAGAPPGLPISRSRSLCGSATPNPEALAPLHVYPTSIPHSFRRVL